MFKSAVIFVVMKPVTTAGQISPNPISYTMTILNSSFHTWKEGKDINCCWQTGVSQHILKETAVAWYMKKALHASVIGTVILCQLQLFSVLYKCWSWKYIMRGRSVNSFLCLVIDITWTCAGYFFTPSSTDVRLYMHSKTWREVRAQKGNDHGCQLQKYSCNEFISSSFSSKHAFLFAML